MSHAVVICTTAFKFH